MSAKVLLCSSNLTQAATDISADTIAGVLSCSGGWTVVDYVPPFDPSQLQPQVVAALFGGGFLLYLVPWACAYGFKSILSMLR